MTHTRLITLLSFSALLLAQKWLSVRQPLPYMDELFHIPQAQALCSTLPSLSLPSYHPAITTPPLLYLPVPVLYTLSFGRIPCTPFVLRLQSAFSYALTIPVYTRILVRLHWLLPGRKSRLPVFAVAIVLFLHPVSLFYAHLFYTDPLCLVLVVFSYLLYLGRRPAFSALACFLASLTRQTSIIWHFFISFLTVWGDMPDVLFPRLVGNVVSLLRTTLWPHIVGGVLYVVFLYVNNGIAVGDRQHHTAVMHWAMAPYFFGFHALSYLPFQLATPQLVLAQLKVLSRLRWMMISGVVGFLFGVCIWRTGDYAHPFALSDNRHYVFYMYRKWLLVSQWRRLALVPVYTWGAVSPLLDSEVVLNGDGGKQEERRKWTREVQYARQEMVGDFVLSACAMASVVPAGLLEPRYFCVGSTIWTLRRVGRCRHGWSSRVLWTMGGILVAVNVALLYVFVEMPFERAADAHMPNDLSPGRFMF